MRNTAVVLVVTCVLVNICFAGFGETVYTSTLSNEQVVPRVEVKKESRGNALFFYDRNSNPPTLRVNVQHSSAYEVTEAGIYLGYPGELGTLLYSFSGYLGSGFKNTISLQQLSVFSGSNYTAAQQGQDFLNGVWYIQISTTFYPNGELRGQILHNDRFYAELSVSHSIPRALSSSASGIAVGTYSPFEPLRQLDASIIHNVQFPKTTGIEIRTGRPGVVGDKLYSFLSSGSPSFDSFEFSISEAENFLKDLLYLNIASDTNPSGEIRGQLTTIDYIGDVAFTARLDSDQVIPSVQNSTRRGCALITLNCDTNLLEYLIMHNVKDARGAFIGIAQADSAGVILFPLSTGQSPIFGSIPINQKDQLLLYARQLYVTVTSQDYPNGEIRGQIGIDYDWWAYLSGTQVVSPVTTASVGCSTFTLRGQQNRIVDYEIFHNIPDATYATLSVGRADAAGVLDRIFDTVYSPIRGADFVLDDDELEALVSDAMYVTIFSRSQPEMGQVRGQIKRINPCSTKGVLDNSLTIDAPVNNDNNNNNKNAEIKPRALPDPEPESDTDSIQVEPVALGAIVIPSLIFAFFMMVLTW